MSRSLVWTRRTPTASLVFCWLGKIGTALGEAIFLELNELLGPPTTTGILVFGLALDNGGQASVAASLVWYSSGTFHTIRFSYGCFRTWPLSKPA